jgi:hypothetical protein
MNRKRAVAPDVLEKGADGVDLMDQDGGFVRGRWRQVQGQAVRSPSASHSDAPLSTRVSASVAYTH